MKILNVVAVGACLWFASPPAQAQTSKGLSPADVTKINEVSQIWVKALLAKDWATMAAQYTEDAVLYPPNEPAVKGRPAIRTWSAGFPPVTDCKVNIVKAEGRDDLAYVLGTFTMTIAVPGAPPVKDSGKFVEVRRRQPDGRWLLAVDMFSSDLPVATVSK